MSDVFNTGGVVHSDGNVTFGGGDKRLIVMFFQKPVLLEFQSKTEGRPIYESRDFIRIIQPGEKDIFEAEAREDHKLRFSDKWEAYKRGQEQVPDGTPTAVLYPHAPHEVEMLRALHIHTAEQLAGLTEQGISRLGMGGRVKVQRAKDFLEAAAKMGGANKLQAELDATREEMAVLKQQIADLSAARPRGRPRKDHGGDDRTEEE